jgi:hypothetical protein
MSSTRERVHPDVAGCTSSPLQLTRASNAFPPQTAMPMNGGSFGILGGLIMPISVLIALRKAPPGPVQRLIIAGATSPETALKPATAKIVRPIELARAVRLGIAIALPDGRYWVDVKRYRRRRLIVALIVGALLGLVAEGAWLYWSHVAK